MRAILNSLHNEAEDWLHQKLSYCLKHFGLFVSDTIAGTPRMARDVRGQFGVQGAQRKLSAWDHPAPRRRPRGLLAKELGLPNP